MQHKHVSITGLKTAGLPDLQFTGWASVFDHVDHQGDTVRRGAFAKSLQSDAVIPICWEHKSDDPRGYVGQVLDAVETDEGLQITGQLDDSEDGQAAYRSIKSRRVTGLSIGYRVRDAVKSATGVTELLDVDLAEISIVSRPANDRALVTSVKSAELRREQMREQVARAQLHTKANMTENRFDTERTEALTKAREITELARELDRDLTDDEAALVKSHLDAAEQATKSIEQATKSAGLMAQLDAMARTAYADTAPDNPSAESDRRLSFGKGMANKIVTKMLDGGGAKALAANGMILAGAEFSPDPISLGKPAMSLLDVLPVVQHDQPTYQVLVQDARNNMAAEVADHALKPTSTYGLQMVQKQLKVVAHITEAVPRYWLSDAPAVHSWVASELIYGLYRAVEGLVFREIAGTSGIQSVPFAVSPVQSLRKSIEALEVQGHVPSAFILAHSDWTALETALTLTTGALDYHGVPLDTVTRRLFGVPVVASQWPAAGSCFVISQGSVAVDTDRDGVQIQWSENATADSFAKNELLGRCEGRFNTSVYQPLGVARVALK